MFMLKEASLRKIVGARSFSAVRLIADTTLQEDYCYRGRMDISLQKNAVTKSEPQVFVLS